MLKNECVVGSQNHPVFLIQRNDVRKKDEFYGFQRHNL